MKNNITGVGVALVTPFGESGQVDYDALERLVGYVTDNGVDYLVALGTTAETPTLTHEEKSKALACIKKSNVKGLPLVVGIGGNNTAGVVDAISQTDLEGAAAVLSVTPYYNKPSQRGLFEHYKAVAANSPVPIMLYNVPSRTGINMTAETTLKLAHQVDNIMGVKEACGTVCQMMHLLKGRPEGFRVISGDDNMAVPLVAMGGDGVISVAANAFPAVFTKLIKAAYNGDRSATSQDLMRVFEAIEHLFTEGNPTGVKAALAIKGLISNNLRLPLVPASDNLMATMKALIEKNKI